MLLPACRPIFPVSIPIQASEARTDRGPDVPYQCLACNPTCGLLGRHPRHGQGIQGPDGRCVVGGGRDYGLLPDSQDEDSRAQGEEPGSGKRYPVGAKPDAQQAPAIRRDRRPDLMAEEHPAEEDRAGAGPKDV